MQCLTLVSGSSNSTNKSKVKLIELKRNRVPDMLRGELIRIGGIWVTMIVPIQNPTFVTEIINPERWKILLHIAIDVL